MGLRERRKKQGMTTQELAKVIGVSHVAVVQWERGSTVPKLRTLAKIAEALHCTQEEVLKDIVSGQRN